MQTFKCPGQKANRRESPFMYNLVCLFTSLLGMTDPSWFWFITAV